MVTNPTQRAEAWLAKLKHAGHSAFKAREIVLDAARGDQHALRWLSVLPEPPKP